MTTEKIEQYRHPVELELGGTPGAPLPEGARYFIGTARSYDQIELIPATKNTPPVFRLIRRALGMELEEKVIFECPVNRAWLKKVGESMLEVASLEAKENTDEL